jgi:hypothetical protein
MERYKQTLKAMYLLLSRTGVDGWAEWISKDIELADENMVEHHLRAYGGMGSFNDVVICTINGHKVTEEHEPWVNNFFQNLQALCYILTSESDDEVYATIIEKAFRKEAVEIQGWRCLKCGYGRITRADIDNFIAPKLLKSMMLRAINNNLLLECGEDVLNLNIPNRKDEYLRIKKLVISSGITIDENCFGWMRPCPNCNDNNTAIYRWKVNKGLFGKSRLTSSETNLSMMKK